MNVYAPTAPKDRFAHDFTLPILTIGCRMQFDEKLDLCVSRSFHSYDSYIVFRRHIYICNSLKYTARQCTISFQLEVEFNVIVKKHSQL